jgi:hypothetical protein
MWSRSNMEDPKTYMHISSTTTYGAERGISGGLSASPRAKPPRRRYEGPCSSIESLIQAVV